MFKKDYINIKCKKRCFLLLLSVMMSLCLQANTYFEVDEIRYFVSSRAEDGVGVEGYLGNSSSIVIPEEVEYEGVKYPVTFIRPKAFSYCKSLNTVVLPSSIIYIYEGAFEGCSNLNSFSIPNSVVHIDNWSFYGCKSLTSITIPQSVTSIGYNAFYECKNLELVKFENNNPSDIFINSDAFAGISSSAIAVVPQGTTKEYMRISNWWNSFDLIKQDGLVSMTIMVYNGYVTYNNQIITSSNGESFSVEEGSSVTIYFTPNDGYKILYVKHNDSDVTSSVSNNQYTFTASSNTNTIDVFFEEISTYNLSISASGNGSASYGGETIRESTNIYTVKKGTKVYIPFTPDDGYRIKSVMANGTDVTRSVFSRSQYEMTINSDTSVEVEFEAIPPTTYTLSISATGNGSASYGGETIRGTTKNYTVNEGTSATITFTPDDGYRIKSLKVDGSAVTASTSYTATVNANTTVEVEFEAIPVTTYSLSITASGNGSASYGGEKIRGTTNNYTVNEGTSATITFTPDDGYRIKSLKVDGSAVTASTSYTVTVNANTTVEVEFEAIPITTYTLSISASGNGSASYGGETIRGTTKNYTVNEGTSATITFTADDGYRIKSLKVDGSAVTASTSYTVTVNANTTVEVEFEAIPITTYTLSVSATGNGSASYGGETIRGTTKNYTVNEGTSATITFTPDDGYRIKSLKVDGTAVTASTSYTVTVNANTTIEVEFEAIPVTPSNYSLSITASGNGAVSYGGETIRGTTKTYTVTEGSSATITITPDNGYQIKSLKVNGSSVSATNSYSVTINSDTTIEVEFEEIPETPDTPDTPDTPTLYTLSIKVNGNGYVDYNGETIRDAVQSYSVNEGENVSLTFTPDSGNQVGSIIINGTSVVASGSYTISNIQEDTSVEVSFEETSESSVITINGVNYQIVSQDEHLLMLDVGDYGLSLEVPEKVESQGEEWTISGITGNALDNSEDLAAIVWNPQIPFTAKVTNPNLLLYVKDEAYAPASIRNVVVNGFAKTITLTDAQSGNNFYCPSTFTTQSIIYTHNYSMKTGLNESKGWETIALPFDVQQISHSSRGDIVPFAKWTSEDATKPFWLFELTGYGFIEADGIKANTPYIISMPNNEIYPSDYQLSGRVTFSALNAEVKKSDNIQTSSFSNRSFVPNYTCQEASDGIYALNVRNDYEAYSGGENEGSKFILNLRKIHPFEAYMTSTSNARAFDIFDDMKTAIRGIEDIAISRKQVKVYDLSGKLLKVGASLDTIKQELPAGMYIVNNQKIMVK